ncbi:MAG: hypothetical protein R3250_14725 [Melioribacteraceae bacterium]|nr:hypothetical protein [Melioribacteraceae bacterium]
MSTTDQRVAKSTITIDIVKQINTNCNLFDLIIYVLSGKDQIMIEKPSSGEIFNVPGYKIGKYLKLKKVKTEWIRHIDGSYSKFLDEYHYHIVPLNNEFGFYRLNIVKDLPKNTYRFLRPINTEHFSLKRNQIKKTSKHFTMSMKMDLPIWPLWALIKSPIKEAEKDKTFTLSRLFMKIEDEFYRFPYGNVNGTDGVCTGAHNNGNFKEVNQVWANWITTKFNFDYKQNLKANTLEDPFKISMKKINELLPVTYDLEHINMMVHYGRMDRVNVIDFLFYLSHIETFDHIEYTKLFFKHPGVPGKVKTG